MGKYPCGASLEDLKSEYIQATKKLFMDYLEDYPPGEWPGVTKRARKEQRRVIVKALKQCNHFLRVPWILDQIVIWMQDDELQDDLKAAIIESRGRWYRRTAKQGLDRAVDTIRGKQIEERIKAGESKTQVCRKMAAKFDDMTEDAFWKVHDRYKKNPTDPLCGECQFYRDMFGMN